MRFFVTCALLCCLGGTHCSNSGRGQNTNDELDQKPQLTVNARFDVGEAISITYSGMPGYASDWIGIYPADQEQHKGSTLWLYTDGTQQGTAGLHKGRVLFRPVSLLPGQWQARAFTQDGHELLTHFNFEVVEPGLDSAKEPTGDLTLMTFNIWRNATQSTSGISGVVAAIRAARPDVIALQECDETTLEAVVTSLRSSDAYYTNAQSEPAANIISILPIDAVYVAADTHAYGVRITLKSGESIRIFNSHLSAYPYGPYEARGGVSVKQVEQLELSSRGAEMEKALSALINDTQNDPQLATALVGDHNCPSYLDWTTESLDQHGLVINWPVSRMLIDAGFRDGFRSVYPDPTKVRGFTWSPGYPIGTLEKDEIHDRIDMIYARNGDALQFEALQAYTLCAADWPSDHRAVVVSYRLIH